MDLGGQSAGGPASEVVDLFCGGGGTTAGMEWVMPAARRRFASLVRWAPGEACWEWAGFRQPRPGGILSYGPFCVRKRKTLAHRMAWMLVHGPIAAGLVVRHRCDNVACVRPDHLLVGTQAENLADMRARGRACFPQIRTGAAHHAARLTPEKVRELRALYAAGGISFAAMGEHFGIHPTSAHAIVKRESWRHVA